MSPLSVVEPIVIEVHLPAGVAGPDPLDSTVRCFLVRHATGIVLIDTGLPGSGESIAAGLGRIGAEWGDVTDIVLTHSHLDHAGGLSEVSERADGATVWSGEQDQPQIPFEGPMRALVEGGQVRDLHVLETPGHTPGHRSLILDDGSLLFAGDVLGTMSGPLTRAPAKFTADLHQAEQTLHRIATLQCERVLFSHGGEIAKPLQALRDLLDG